MRVLLIQLVGFLISLMAPAGLLAGQPPPTRPDGNGPTTYFWGIHRGCARDGYLSAGVENRLRLTSGRVVTVGSDLVATSVGCLGEECLRSFKSVCIDRQGILIGGVIVQRSIPQSGGEPVMWQLIRLWRVETASGQATYLQHACRKCDLPSLLPYLTAELLESPPSASMTAKDVRSAKPLFCGGVESQTDPSLPGEQRIAVVVSGVREARAARGPLLRVLKEHLAQTGREVVRVADEGSTVHSPDLAAFIGKKVANDVLGVELLAEGQVRLRLLTAGTLATRESAADCLGCNDTALAKRVVMAAGPLVDRCSGAQCGLEAMATPLRWPDDICLPSSEPSCKLLAPEATPDNGQPSLTTLCGPLVETSPITPPSGPDGNGLKPPLSPRMGTGRIIGATVLGVAAVAVGITASVLISKAMQPVDGPCYSRDGLLVGRCIPPSLEPAYGVAFTAGALLGAGAVVTIWPFKPSSKQSTTSTVSR